MIINEYILYIELIKRGKIQLVVENRKKWYGGRHWKDRKFSIYPKFGNKLNKKAQNVGKSLYTKYGSYKVNYNNICIVNIKECSFSCRCFLKNGIGLHSSGYSHLKDLNWFGPKFTVRWICL